MAAIMASTYKAYLGVGLGPLSVGTFVDFAVELITQMCQSLDNAMEVFSDTYWLEKNLAVFDEVSDTTSRKSWWENFY